MTESPHQKFVRLSEQRLEGLLDKIRIMGNLSNSYIYEYKDRDLRNIFNKIDAAVAELKSKFDYL